jgi:hypothetical protein
MSCTTLAGTWKRSMSKPDWSVVIDWLLRGVLVLLVVWLVLARLFDR